MRLSSGYHTRIAAAYVRGETMKARACGGLIASTDSEINGRPLELSPALIGLPLDALTEEEIETVLSLGRAAGLKLYHFKKSHAELPRVRYILGFLRSLHFETLLDVGSGRGAFLWPAMDAFPHARVTSLDLLPSRVELLDTVRLGGVDSLQVKKADICAFGEADGAYDVVTLLEVLEHIPDVAAAIRNAVRLARQYVVVTVPSRPDDNPEHIHLLTKETLTRLFSDSGCARLRFGGVGGHLTMIASKEK